MLEDKYVSYFWLLSLMYNFIFSSVYAIIFTDYKITNKWLEVYFIICLTLHVSVFIISIVITIIKNKYSSINYLLLNSLIGLFGLVIIYIDVVDFVIIIYSEIITSVIIHILFIIKCMLLCTSYSSDYVRI